MRAITQIAAAALLAAAVADCISRFFQEALDLL